MGEQVANDHVCVAEVCFPKIAVAKFRFAAPEKAEEFGPEPYKRGEFVTDGFGAISFRSFVHQAAVSAAKVVDHLTLFDVGGFEHAAHLSHFRGHKRCARDHGVDRGNQHGCHEHHFEG